MAMRVIDPKTKRGGKKLQEARDSGAPVTIKIGPCGPHQNCISHINWKILAREECSDCGASWVEGGSYGDGPNQCPRECVPKK